MDFFDRFKLLIILAVAFMGLIGLMGTCPDKREEWDGLISEKYLDVKNHSYQTIVITNSRRVDKVIFVSEVSGFYNTVQVGDYINKKSGSLNVILQRDGIKTTRKLNYNCD